MRVRITRRTVAAAPAAPASPLTGLNDPTITTLVQLYDATRRHPGNSIAGWTYDPSSPWFGKEKQESLLRLFAYLKCIPAIEKYTVCVGNFNKGSVAPAPDLRALFYRPDGAAVELNDSGDVSDLTGICGAEILATTSKNLGKYTVGKLDVEKIINAFAQSVYTTNTLRLCVVVPSRDEFNSVVKRAKDTSNHIVSHLRKESTIILDGSDLDVAFRSFKAVYGNRTLDEVLNGAAPRRPLALRPHQSLALAETAAIRATGARNASWGQIPRSGKGYIMAAFIAADSRGKTACNYIIITTAPNETLDQYETILRCADLDGFNVLRLPRNSAADLGAKNIVICSKQYLQSKFDETPAPGETASAVAAEPTETGIAKPDIKKGGKGKGRAKKVVGRRGTPPITQYFNRTPPPVVVAPALVWLAALRFDARFIDESHLGGATDLARQMLSCFGADAFTVFVTATYAKPVHTYGIPATRQVIWDLADVAAAKRFTDPAARALVFAKHPLAETVFDGVSPARVSEIYGEYPELTILTRELTPETIAALRDAPDDDGIGTGKYGWSPKSCLLLKQSAVVDQSGRKGKGKVVREPEFQNKTETIKMLRDVFGPPRDQFGRPTVAGYDNNFIERARNVCNNGAADSRFMLDPGHNVDPTVVMMFLPSNDVDTTSTALKSLIDSDNALPEYGICIINSKHAGDPKQTIVEARATAKRDGKRALLVLSGRQCSLGVTIPGCDVVVLMNGGGSGAGASAEDDDAASDMVYQMMFRGMTEAPGKRFGFVIDMDIRRSLRAVMTNQCVPVPQAASGNRATIRQTITTLLRERTVSLNPDQWEPRFRGGAGATETEALALAAERYAARVYDAYTAHKGRLLGELIATLGFKSDMFARNDCAFLRALVTPMRGAVGRVKALAARDTGVPDGIEKVTVGDKSDPTKAPDAAAEAVQEPDEDKEPTAEEMVRHLVPILSFLTIHETTSSVRHMMDLIKSDPEMMDVLLDRTRAWWGDKGSAENVDTLVAVYEIHMACDARQVATVDMVKDLFVQNIDNAAELSRLIDQHLVPLESEKKANAEVSTPAPLRKDMGDKMPPEFWTAPHRVLEPCAGKGGFLVDMMGRFMVGLAATIPDPVERRRVIVEECLYWADINPFNVLVCRILLDPFGTHKTKGYLGDSLALDAAAQWGVTAFDAVVGNPPYNSAGNTGTGNTIWQKFVQRALTEWIAPSGLLVFVHPPGWRKPNTERGKYIGLFELMTRTNQMIYLEIHNSKDGMRVFGCGTRYDWYVIRHSPFSADTVVNDETGTIANVRMADADFLPNSQIDIFLQLIARGDEPRCDVLYSRSDYGCDKSHTSYTQTATFTYPCIHATLKDGAVRYMYSNTREYGHFEVPKLIIGQTGYVNAVVDMIGEYAVTDNAIAICVNDADECDALKRAIESDAFRAVLRACSWSNYRIDWRLFANFKREFWREFV